MAVVQSTERSKSRLAIFSYGPHVAVVDFSVSCRACSHLVIAVLHVGEVAPPARGEHRPITAHLSRSQRPPKRHRGTVAAPFTRHCSPNTHVEPTTRRLGGRCRVAVPTCCGKEHAVHHWLQPAALLYVPVVLELSWSFANHAQLSS
jgi:hypothetical protein